MTSNMTWACLCVKWLLLHLLVICVGDYEFCFDNTGDTFGRKKVEAFIAVMNPEDPFKADNELMNEIVSNATIESYTYLSVRLVDVVKYQVNLYNCWK